MKISQRDSQHTLFRPFLYRVPTEVVLLPFYESAQKGEKNNNTLAKCINEDHFLYVFSFDVLFGVSISSGHFPFQKTYSSFRLTMCSIVGKIFAIKEKFLKCIGSFVLQRPLCCSILFWRSWCGQYFYGSSMDIIRGIIFFYCYVVFMVKAQFCLAVVVHVM